MRLIVMFCASAALGTFALAVYLAFGNWIGFAVMATVSLAIALAALVVAKED